MPSLVLFALGLLPFAWALQINNPGHPATGSSVTVTWSHSASDPAKFDLYLWNGAAQTPAVNKLLAGGVTTATGAVSVRIPCDIPSSGAYQLFAVNGANASDIYARSSQFSIAVVDCKETTTTTTTTSVTKTTTGTTSSTGTKTDTSSTTSSTVTKPTSSVSSSGTCTSSEQSHTESQTSKSTSIPTSGGNTTVTVPCSTPCKMTTTVAVTPTGSQSPTTIPIGGAPQAGVQLLSVAAAFIVAMMAT